MKIKTLLLVCLSISSTAVAEAPCGAKSFKYSLPAAAPLKVPVGEKLTYAIKYQFIRAGTATLTITEGPETNCRPTYHFESKAESSGFVDTFFVVRDFNSSIADKESLISFGFHQNLREGKFRVIRTTTLDHSNATFHWEKQYKGKTTNRTGALSQPVFDILSAFFKTRSLDLEFNGRYEIPVFNDADFYMLKVNVAPKLEDVVVPAGRFECYRLDPEIQGDGIFKMRDGRIQIWITADEQRIPVLIRSKVAIGAVDAELERFDTPQIDMVNEKVPTR